MIYSWWTAFHKIYIKIKTYLVLLFFHGYCRYHQNIGECMGKEYLKFVAAKHKSFPVTKHAIITC